MERALDMQRLKKKQDLTGAGNWKKRIRYGRNYSTNYSHNPASTTCIMVFRNDHRCNDSMDCGVAVHFVLGLIFLVGDLAHLAEPMSR